MKKYYVGLSMVLMLSRCISNVPNNDNLSKNFVNEFRARAYAEKLRRKDIM